jgi:hypothetical protein
MVWYSQTSYEPLIIAVRAIESYHIRDLIFLKLVAAVKNYCEIDARGLAITTPDPDVIKLFTAVIYECS